MADSLERIQCQWCEVINSKTALNCQACGAPLDFRNAVSESGWRETPRIRDRTEIRFNSSTCQVEGEIVPVAEISLAAGDSIFFEQQVMLWKETSAPLSVMPPAGAAKRVLGGRPVVLNIASGPGRIAFSRDASGELVVLPLHPGMELDVREHAFLLSSQQIEYSFVRVTGLTSIFSTGTGIYIDRFITTGKPGLLILHGYGNVFERKLGPGESILLEPGAFLYKDSSVQMNVEAQVLGKLARMTGPGRVGVQSMSVQHETE